MATVWFASTKLASAVTVQLGTRKASRAATPHEVVVQASATTTTQVSLASVCAVQQFAAPGTAALTATATAASQQAQAISVKTATASTATAMPGVATQSTTTATAVQALGATATTPTATRKG